MIEWVISFIIIIFSIGIAKYFVKVYACGGTFFWESCEHDWREKDQHNPSNTDKLSGIPYQRRFRECKKCGKHRHTSFQISIPSKLENASEYGDGWEDGDSLSSSKR